MFWISSKVEQHCTCIWTISPVNCLFMFIHVPIPLIAPFLLICCMYIWMEILYICIRYLSSLLPVFYSGLYFIRTEKKINQLRIIHLMIISFQKEGKMKTFLMREN